LKVLQNCKQKIKLTRLNISQNCEQESNQQDWTYCQKTEVITSQNQMLSINIKCRVFGSRTMQDTTHKNTQNIRINRKINAYYLSTLNT